MRWEQICYQLKKAGGCLIILHAKKINKESGGRINIKPFWRNRNGSLLVIPYYWEDGNYMGDGKFNIPDFSRLEYTKGIKIFNFHPIHLFTNADSINFYNDKLKNIYHDVDKLIKIRKSYGIRNFLEELSSTIFSFQNETRTLFEFSRSALKL